MTAQEKIWLAITFSYLGAMLGSILIFLIDNYINEGWSPNK